MLYVFRAVCGIGQGGVQSLTMVIVSDVTTLQDRGKYQGILGAFIGLGNSLGPFICAGFVMHSSWRNFYHTLVPFFAIGLLIIYKIVPSNDSPISRAEKIRNIDFIGFFFSTAGLVLLLIPINSGGNLYAWDSALVISMLVIGPLCLVVFVVVEWKVARLPMIPMRLFKAPSLDIIFLQSFLFGAAFFGMPYFFSYYFEVVKGYTPVITSCFTMAILLTQAVFSIISGQIISRTGHYIHVIRCAYVLGTLGTGLLLLWTPYTNPGICVIMLLLIGAGNGGIFQPTLVAAQSHARIADRSVVISTRNVLRSLGGAVGTAVCSLIYSNTLLQRLNSDTHLSASSIAYIKRNLYSKISLDSLPSAEISYAKSYYMALIKNIFYMWFPFMAVSLVLSIFISDHGLCGLDQREEYKLLQEKLKLEKRLQKAKKAGHADVEQAVVEVGAEVEQVGAKQDAEKST